MPVVHVLSEFEHKGIEHFHASEMETLRKENNVSFTQCSENIIEVRSPTEHFEIVTEKFTILRKNIQGYIKEKIIIQHAKFLEVKMHNIARKCPKVYFRLKNNLIILCGSDYQEVFHAKHLLLVAIGKKQQPSTISALQQTVIPDDVMMYTTASGLQVLTYDADISTMTLDVIVNAANGTLKHSGGVARTIFHAAGPNLQRECDDYIIEHGQIKVTENCVTSSGNLPCKLVIHAVFPCWYCFDDEEMFETKVRDTVFNCLVTANDKKMSSIGIPLISAGKYH